MTNPMRFLFLLTICSTVLGMTYIYPGKLVAQDESDQPKSEKKKDEAESSEAKSDEKTDSKDGAAEAAEVEWMTSMEKALAKAKKENKSLLVNFTGSDWCIWCKRLESEVFSTKPFVDKAYDDFVLVMLDFPSDQSKHTEEGTQWKDKLSIAGFPTIMLLDNEGRPFAKTGYQEGGPKPYLKNLDKLNQIRKRRDVALADAAKKKGIDRAKSLDKAISEIDENFVSDHYEGIIKEIVSLDEKDELGLRTKYFAAQDAEQRKMILTSIAMAARTLEPKMAISKIDETLVKMTLPIEMKVDALQHKIRILRKMGRVDEAVKILSDVAEEDGIGEELFNQLVIQRVYIMVGAGNTDKAIALLDTQIKNKIDNLELFIAKGELLSRVGKHKLALESFDQAAVAVKDDPDTLAEVYSLKADSLIELGKNEEALELFDRFADRKDYPTIVRADMLVQKSVLLKEFGKVDGAKEAQLKALELVKDPDERDEIRDLIEQIGKID